MAKNNTNKRIRKKFVAGEAKAATKRTLRKRAVRAFTSIYGNYIELRSVTGTTSCAGLYRSFSMVSQFSSSYSADNVNHVTSSDFLADSELTAKKILNEDQYRIFISGNGNTLSTYLKIKLGREFRIRGIFPVSKYFSPSKSKTARN